MNSDKIAGEHEKLLAQRRNVRGQSSGIYQIFLAVSYALKLKLQMVSARMMSCFNQWTCFPCSRFPSVRIFITVSFGLEPLHLIANRFCLFLTLSLQDCSFLTRLRLCCKVALVFRNSALISKHKSHTDKKTS